MTDASTFGLKAPTGPTTFGLSDPKAAPEQVYYNELGQPFTLSGKPPPTPPDEGYTGSILPLRRDQGGLHLAIPESIASPVRGAIEAGERMLGVGEAGQSPLRPLSPDILGTLLTTEIGRAAAGKPDVGPPAEAPIEVPRAAQVVGKALGKDIGGGLSLNDVMDQMSEARAEGQPLTLLDVGDRNIRRLGGKIYRGPGEAPTQIRQFQEARTTALTPGMETAQGARINDAIDRYISDGNLRDAGKRLAEQRSANAKPLWNEAMSRAPVWSPRLQEFIDSPDFKKGLRLGWVNEKRTALAEGRPINAADYAIVDFNEAGDPVIGKVPTMRLLQMAKEGVDHLLEDPSLRDPLTGRLTKTGRAIFAEQKAFLAEADKLNPQYAAAREQWSGDTATLRSLRDGRDLFNRSLDFDEIKERVGDMPEGDKQFYRLGAASKLRELMGNAPLSADESKRIINSSSGIKRLGLLFDDKAEFERFVRNIMRERMMYETGTDIMKGSQTAERTAADVGTSAGLHAAHAAGHAAHGNIIGALGSAARSIGHLMSRQNPELNAQLARILTDPRLSIYMPPAGPRQMPVVGPAAVERAIRDIRNLPPPP